MNRTATTAHVVRLGVSLTGDERRSIGRRFGRSHAVRIAGSLSAWDAAVCTCHGLYWSINDLRYTWAGQSGEPTACPLTIDNKEN